MNGRMSRRTFLKATSAGAVVLLAPWTLEACGDGEHIVTFLNEHERATVQAAAARLLPTDGAAGSSGLDAVQYIENLLTAFEHDPPTIYAGGPFSGRAPFPDGATGQPSDTFPDDAFVQFLPLSRTKELAWRIRLYGSTGVTGGDFNDAVLGPTAGFRAQYRRGVRDLDAKSKELFSKNFVGLSALDQDQVLTEGDQEFAQLLLEHAIEGRYAAPEYGGNTDLAGWQSIGHDGDSQPLGYAIYDEGSERYNERPEKPLSTPNPGEDSSGIQGDVLEFVDAIVGAVGGTRFF
ncbi:MAG: gluconate 2-dehydrogenase subunit 3 family protein [Dehalococcoidia bacterium]